MADAVKTVTQYNRDFSCGFSSHSYLWLRQSFPLLYIDQCSFSFGSQCSFSHGSQYNYGRGNYVLDNSAAAAVTCGNQYSLVSQYPSLAELAGAV